MNDRSKPRRPATFRLDDPDVVVTEAEETSRLGRTTIQITPEHDPQALPVPIDTALPARRGFRWGALFWSGVAGLTLLGTGHADKQQIAMMLKILLPKAEPASADAADALAIAITHAHHRQSTALRLKVAGL